MNRFAWTNASTINEAVAQINSTVADATVAAGSPVAANKDNQTANNTAIAKAGGIDVLDLLKEGLVTPSRVINIRTLPNMDRISADAQTGLRIGPLVTLAQLDADPAVRQNYTALAEAASHIATPQIRNIATIGGNLLQRPRCWYFRAEQFRCLKRGGEQCFAIEGEHKYLAIFNNEVCPCVHASTAATALVALGARLVLTSPKKVREVALEDFFVTPEKDVQRENSLQPNELITEIRVPVLGANVRSVHLKQGEKESFDWASADTAVMLEQSGGRCTKASIILGSAAPVPLRAQAAEAVLIGKPINQETARAAARAAVQGAKPLPQNAYKVPIFEVLVRRAILLAASNAESTR
ncbi:xanthine dehydrogenase family protein subunit M [Scytonema sp. NUACC21]